MTIPGPDPRDRLNNRLAQLLAFGTWASCGLIAVGTVLQLLSTSARPEAQHLLSTGILLLIVLPTVRVAAMVTWFLVHRDLDFAVISVLVLVIMLASTLLGTSAV